MNIVSTCDLYEASFYYSNSCVLEKIETFQMGKKYICEMFFKGEEIYTLRDTCLKGDAMVNLSTFRTAYSKLLQETYFAKKEFQKELKEGKNE